MTTQTETAQPARESEPHSWLFAMMMTEAGVLPESDACTALWEHFHGITPLPAEYEPVRQRCRDAPLGALARLEGTR